MIYLLIAAIVFILSSVIVYATTHKKYIGAQAEVRGVYKAQYLRGVFGVGLFFTFVVMMIIKVFKG